MENLIGYVDFCVVRLGFKNRLREFCLVFNFLELFDFDEKNFVNKFIIFIEVLCCLGYMMRNGWFLCINMLRMFGGIS